MTRPVFASMLVVPLLAALAIAAPPDPARRADAARAAAAGPGDRQRVTVVAGFRESGDLVERLARLTRSSLVPQASVAQRQVLVHCPDTPIEELLAALAVATHAVWRRVGEVRVLTDTPGSEGLAAMPDTPRFKAFSQAHRGLDLTPAQAALLKAGTLLWPRDLLPSQVADIRRWAWFLYVTTRHVPPEVLLLEGAYLAARTGKPDMVPNEVGIFLPQVGGGPVSPDVMIPYENLRIGAISDRGMVSGELFPGLPAPLTPALPPALTGVIPRYPGLRDAELERDPRLEARAELPRPTLTVFAALEAAGRASEAGLLVSTSYGARELVLPSKSPTARALLQAVARATAGTWKRMGGTLVLQTEPRLERLGEMYEVVRKERLRAAAGALVQGLERRQVRALRESGRLAAAQLPVRQQEHLKHLARAAFSLTAAIEPQALQGREGGLRVLEPGGEPPGEPWQLGVELPVEGGAARVVARVPLE